MDVSSIRFNVSHEKFTLNVFVSILKYCSEKFSLLEAVNVELVKVNIGIENGSSLSIEKTIKVQVIGIF